MEAHRVDDDLGVSAHPLKAPLVWLAEETWCRIVRAQTEARDWGLVGEEVSREQQKIGGRMNGA